jgi:ubiquinone/menaquinone biosynthesis C-methylase UbiE
MPMGIKESYNRWSINYDTVPNKTRDAEAVVLRDLLSNVNFSSVIELGCGTGKNTQWLAERADHVVAVDFSEEMMNEAKKKIAAPNVEFTIADITKAWAFSHRRADLITCSLILEHIQNIEFIFEQASQRLGRGGLFYIGELHPYKQYQGTKARFETDSGLVTLDCFTHHISEYMGAATRNKFSCLSMKEGFDDNDQLLPRIVSFLFQKG